MFEFADSSLKRLKEIHPDLQLICKRVKELSVIDFDISCGYRSEKEQKELYKKGLSQLDGIKHKSKHNYIPARAVDIYCYNGSKADYSKEKMKYMADLFLHVTETLYSKGEITNHLEWGGSWADFVDMPHYELIT